MIVYWIFALGFVLLMGFTVFQWCFTLLPLPEDSLLGSERVGSLSAILGIALYIVIGTRYLKEHKKNVNMRILFIIGLIVTGVSVMFSTDLFFNLLFVCLFYLAGFWKEIIWGEHISNAEINKMSVKVQYETKTTNYWRLIRKICIKTYINNSEIRYNENYLDKSLYKAIHKTIWDMEVKRERWYNKLKSEEYWKALARIEEEIYYLDCMQ